MKELKPEEIANIDMVKSIVCEYYNFPIEYLETNSRKNGIPMMKQIICYLVINYLKSIKKYKLGLYFKTNHANVLIGVKKLSVIINEDASFSKEISDLVHVMDLKGVISRNYSEREWMKYFDLNNFISAKWGDKFIIFKGYDMEFVESLLDSKYEISEHTDTKHFVFARKLNKK